MDERGPQALSDAALLLLHDPGGQILMENQSEEEIIRHQIPRQSPPLSLTDQGRREIIGSALLLRTREKIRQPPKDRILQQGPTNQELMKPWNLHAHAPAFFPTHTKFLCVSYLVFYVSVYRKSFRFATIAAKNF